MGLTIVTDRVACNTSTGNQAITVSAGGLTPKAAIFILVGATSDGSAANDASLSYGAATGASNRWCVVGYGEDNQSTSDTQNALELDNCIQLIDGDGANVCLADFVSFGANTVTINWSDAPPSAYLLTVISFSGSDLSAHADAADGTDTQDNTVDVTDPGFEPDVLFTAMNCAKVADGTAVDLYHSFGLVHSDGEGGVTQRGVHWSDRNAKDTTQSVCNTIDTGGVLMNPLNSTAIDFYMEFDTFDGDGFSMHARNAGGNWRRVCYLALSFGGQFSSWVGTHSTPTSTGSQSSTAPGFKPQFLFFLGTFAETINTGYLFYHSTGLMAIDASNQLANSICSEDGVATSNCQSLSDDIAVELPDHDGSAGLTASFTSFDANGWTLNFSAVEGNAKLFFALAIEEEVSGYTITADQGSYSLSGQAAALLADRIIAAAQGSYTLSGQSANLNKGFTLAAVQGSYSLSGQAAGLLTARLISAAQGSYTLTGQSAGLLIARTIAAAQGSYALTGQAVDLLIARLLTAVQGSYTLTGQDVTLTYTPITAYTLVAEQGAYVLTGQSANFEWIIEMVPDSANAIFIKFRDKREVVEFGDPREIMKYKDKRKVVHQ